MDRPTRVKKKDRTGVWISFGAHVAVIVIALIILSRTELGRELWEKTIGATRADKKQAEKPKPPPAPARTKGPPKAAADAPPPSGGRRVTDAPPPVGEGIFTEDRKKTESRSGGRDGGTNVQQRAVVATAPKLVPKPSVFAPRKTDIKQLLVERSKASALVESFGTEQISKSGASDVSDIVSRISGASLADGKFAVVRGLSDRYTLTTFNGADIPSADPNRRAVQLDLFPAQFISKVDVSKTFQPDQPGGFAGGLVNIVTRSFPDRPLLSFSFGASYNAQANLRDDFLITDHGSLDRFAFDDGTRELPADAAATSPRGDAGVLPIDDSFNSRQASPLPGNSSVNPNFALAFGDTTTFLGKRLGLLAGINYKTDYNYYDAGQVTRYQAVHPTNTAGVNQSWSKSDARSVIEYNWGSMVTLAYELSDNHQLGFNFIWVQTAEDEARRLQGQDPTLEQSGDYPVYLDQSILHWTERTLTYYQLQGKHEFPELRDVQMDWVGSLSATTQDEPDHRIFQFQASPNDPNDPTDDNYLADGTTKPNKPTRIFRTVEDHNANFRADWTLPVASYNSKENSVKSGFAISRSEQMLFTRAFEVLAKGNHPFNTGGDPGSYFDPTNNAFIEYKNFPANFQYDGDQTIGAWYGMGTWSATEWLRLVGGVRHESTDISVDTVNISNGDRKFADIVQDDLLPAVSATFQIRSNLQFRAAWSQTVARPTYREISDAEIYDVALGRTISGNTNLTMSASENFDVRLEWYPRAGELISFGVFVKQIDQPIELAAVTVDNENIKYVNYDVADVFGFEVEFRKNFRGLWGAPWDQVSLGLNYAYIQSEVALTAEQKANRAKYGETGTTRPLYDQPEFVVNGDISWDIFVSGTTLTLNGGVTGRRLVLVGLAAPDEYEEPAPYLDFAVSQKLGRYWKVKFSAKNLLDPAFEVTQTWPSIGTVPIKSYQKGRSYGISFSADF